ncbi:MAG: hypothetical protein EON49_28030, partial [Acidovorax sp.]
MQAQCDKGTWSRGAELHRQGAVLRIAVKPDGMAGWALDGEVLGSQPVPYAVRVQLTLSDAGVVQSWWGE